MVSRRTTPAGQREEMIDGGEIHNYDHAADRHAPWARGPSAGRAIRRRIARVTRNQRDREARVLGYRDLGGES